MKTSSITVSKDMVTRLNKLKYKYELNSIEEVIEKLLNILTKFDLANEYKEEKEDDSDDDKDETPLRPVFPFMPR
jgi:predicted CopG family antitoxin